MDYAVSRRSAREARALALSTISSNSFSALRNSLGDMRSFASATKSLKESTRVSIADFDLRADFAITI